MESIKSLWNKIKAVFNRYPKLICFAIGFACGAYHSWIKL